MVRTTRTKATRRKNAAGEEISEEPSEVNESAEAVLTGETSKVVANLTEQAFRGSPRCLHELKDLSDTAPCEEQPGTALKGFSQAAAWMSEPEWNGASSEGKGETSAGSREPECVTG